MSEHTHRGGTGHNGAMGSHEHHYVRFAVMITLSFIAMYVLMYAMVDRFENVHHNLNQVYMAGLMAAAMVVIELLIMGGMYRNKRLNALLVAAGVIALVAFWIFTRRQTAIGDTQFLRSMIPHHAGAILMCEQAAIQDPQITELCRSIVRSQQDEINQMRAMLNARNR